MPLEMRFHEGKWCPVVVCDHCGERIESACDGNNEWRQDDPTPRFIHKHCSNAFEDSHGGRAAWLSGELRVFCIYLADNLNLDDKQARRLANLAV
jgi:hypothetical protein